MTQILIGVDDRRLQIVFTETTKVLDDLTPAMGAIGEYMVGRTRERFDESTAPDGRRWAPLAEATIRAKRRRQKGGQGRTGKSIARTNASAEDILKDTYLLRDTIAYRPTARDVAIGTPQRYGLHHQYGAPRRNVVARPFLGANNDDAREIEAIVLDAIDVLR
jgi:phage virion morphogenesis protein